MTKAAAKKKSRKKSRAVVAASSTIERPEAGVPRSDTIPGLNGGTLYRGAASGGRGPAPGTGGRPTSLLRSNLTAILETGVDNIRAIAEGKLVEKKRFRVLDLLPYVELECPNCGIEGAREALRAKLASDDYMYQTIECEVSATAKDRLSAYDLAGKYGPGTVKQIGVETVRDKVVETLDYLRGRLDPALFEEVKVGLRVIWVVRAA